MQELHEEVETSKEGRGMESLATALQAFKEKIEARFAATELRISDLASEVGFTPAYLRRTFRTRYGCSPKEYLDQLRYEHALRRLRFTGESVSEIARACGYLDVYQFSKAFKKRSGLAPTEYRKKHQV